MDATPATSAVVPPPRWWAAAAALLALGYGLVLLVLVAMHSGGNWFNRPSPIPLPAARFELVRGGGQPSGSALVVTGLDASGTAILSARVSPFAAERYPRVDWQLRTQAFVPPSLAFLWRTREQPTRTFSKPLEWVGNRVAPLELGPGDGWTGTITGVALVVRAPLQQPLALEAVTLPGVSAGLALDDVRKQWTAFYPLRISSISFPFDEERSDWLSLLAATALAQLLACAGYALLARRRRWPQDARVYWAIFFAGWLLLDARWQVNLWRQLADTAGQFAGKTNDEKHLTSADGDFFTLMREVNAALPPPPARVLLLSDSPNVRARGAFFLYPHSANGFFVESSRKTRVPDPDKLQAGDFLLLVLYRGLTYDRATRELVWPDGRRKPVDEVLFNSNAALVRIK